MEPEEEAAAEAAALAAANRPRRKDRGIFSSSIGFQPLVVPFNSSLSFAELLDLPMDRHGCVGMHKRVSAEEKRGKRRERLELSTIKPIQRSEKKK